MNKFLLILILFNSSSSLVINQDQAAENKTYQSDLVAKLSSKIDHLRSLGPNGTHSKCFSGSINYQDSCIYFSKPSEQLSWLRAERFCRKLPFNTSFLVIENERELEMLRRQLIKIKQNEKSRDQIAFSVGLYMKSGIWTWTNTKTLNESSLISLADWPEDYNDKGGACGSIALTRSHQIAIKSTPCSEISSRFICKYTLNPCFTKDICGNNGKCVNLVAGFYCDCASVSYFHTGKYCEKLNLRAFQVFAGVIMVVLFVTFILIAYLKARIVYLMQSIESTRRERPVRTRRRPNIHSENSDYARSESTSLYSEPEFRHVIFSTELSRGYSSTYLSTHTRLRTYIRRSLSIKIRKGLTRLRHKYFRKEYQNSFFFIIKLFVVLMLVVGQAIIGHVETLKLNISVKASTATTRACELFDSYLSEELVFLVFAIVIIFSIILSKRSNRFNEYIYEKHKNYLDKSKLHCSRVENNIQNKFVSKMWSIMSQSSLPAQSTPFSISNRSASSAIYILYTYDVLNILMSVYTDNLAESFMSTLLPNISLISGVIVDFLFQILQVLLIGVKFYPILVALDSGNLSSIVTNMLALVHLVLIWIIRMIKNWVCVRKEGFFRRNLLKLSKNLLDKFYTSMKSKLVLASKILKLLMPEPDISDKYESIIESQVPRIFKEEFYNHSRSLLSSNKSRNMLEVDSYYSDSSSTRNETHIESTTVSMSFVHMIQNKSRQISSQGSLDQVVSRIEIDWLASTSLMENLPQYIAFSYLLVHLTFSLLSSLIDLWRRTRRGVERSDDISSIYSVRETSFRDTINKIQTDTNEPENHNIKYIRSLFKKCQLYPTSRGGYSKRNSSVRSGRVKNMEKISNYIQKQKSILIERTSFFLNLFEEYIYKPVPHIKYSKQFINTYTIAFMLVYFLTLYGIKIADQLSSLAAYFLKLLFKFLFNESVGDFKSVEEQNFADEFKTSIILTFVCVIVQLLLGIRKFHSDVIKLHAGENFFTLLLFKHKRDTYSTRAKKRDKMMSKIIANSIHYPGYLIAHLVYGYFLLFLATFVFIFIVKFLYHFPRITTGLIQVVLPFVIMIFLKYFIVEWFLPRYLFLRRIPRSERDQDGLYKPKKAFMLNSYYLVSYFNFFLDCFLGLTSCMSRIWLNNVLSVLTLTRIDISVFNHESLFLIRRLDKAYLAYISYIRMEHIYNNPILNGFCDMMVDSMIQSNRLRESLNRLILEQDRMRHYESLPRPIYQRPTSLQIDHTYIFIKDVKRHQPVPRFNYDSLIRLRNILYLCLLLKRNPTLAKLRFRNLKHINKPLQETAEFHVSIRNFYKNLKAVVD